MNFLFALYLHQLTIDEFIPAIEKDLERDGFL